MASTYHYWLFGAERTRYWNALWLVLALLLFLTTFTAYVLDVFTIAGGIVWIPGDAALLGAIATIAVGFNRGGVLAAWLVMFASLLGYRADHAFFGLSYRSFSEQLAYFLELEGLVVLGIEALVFGLIAFVFGTIGRWGFNRVRDKTISSS